MKLRVLIVDDEPLARASLRAYLLSEPDIEVVGECADGRDAVAVIRQSRPDLVFLDVDLPQLDGFRLLEELGAERMPAVVFVTGHNDHAVRAFDVNALDYLVKPFGLQRFRAAFRRARTIVEQQNGSVPSERLHALLEELRVGRKGLETLLAHPGKPYLERVMVKSGERVLLVRTPEIDWIESEGNYARLHVGREAYLIRSTMNALEEALSPRQFLRVHRSTIVNLDRMRELRPGLAGEYLVVLEDGTELRLSRTYRVKLEERLGQADAAP